MKINDINTIINDAVNFQSQLNIGTIIVKDVSRFGLSSNPEEKELLEMARQAQMENQQLSV